VQPMKKESKGTGGVLDSGTSSNQRGVLSQTGYGLRRWALQAPPAWYGHHSLMTLSAWLLLKMQLALTCREVSLQSFWLGSVGGP
jgi:hypothetical protein